ncbi:MAG: 8-oxo-dGTP diphosphatase [Streptosporangiaceae bacterium]
MITRTCLCLVVRPGRVIRPGLVDRPAVADQPGRSREVLLGFKKSGFGAGRWVGLGGHIEDGEEAAAAAAREVAEESGLIVSGLVHMASLNFIFPARPAWNQTADVFVTGDFTGDAAESDEVIPRWFGTDEFPFDDMWDDARYWMPLVLAGERVCADITFADDCATVAAADPDLLSRRG